ncbi:hypothetical protein QA612_12820 [Evansella sp. AB-P1]|nr:hypothetical protein [Evansella sp. AB-P1]MDG5788364.1 hypothetical protein [Evansella sp. AB-P1]
MDNRKNKKLDTEQKDEFSGSKNNEDVNKDKINSEKIRYEFADEVYK